MKKIPKLVLFTMPNCGICKIVKEKLEKKGIPFRELNVIENASNAKLAEKYNVKMAGTIIDTESGEVYDVD